MSTRPEDPLPPPRFQRLRQLFTQAEELAPAEREAFVRQSAGADSSLAEEVLGMLQAGEAVPTRLVQGDAHRALERAMDPPQPERIGLYRIVGRLGRGGMGVVYRAERSDLKNSVAIKVAQASTGLKPAEVLARFELERRALAAMSHRCIAKVFDAGTTEQGQPFFVMELVDGEPLTQFCDQRRLSVPDRLQLFQQICDGVQHAHSKGVVHRDLKPDNVLVVDEGGTAVPKILDFGIAKAANPERFDAPRDVTEAVSQLGTLVYMSPEQVEGRSGAVDARSDIYTLGVMLYELLVGQLPFSNEVLQEVQRKLGLPEVLRLLSKQDPDKPSVRVSGRPGSGALAELRRSTTTNLRRMLAGDLDWIVLEAMAKEPERRYATAQELAEDLQRHLDHKPVRAGPPSAAYRFRKLVRRHRVPMAAGVVVCVSLAIGTTVATRTAWGAEEQKVIDQQRIVEQQKLVAQQRVTNAFQAGRLAMAQGDFPAALAHFDAALAGGPADPIAVQLLRFDALEAMGKSDDAAALLPAMNAAVGTPHAAKVLLLRGVDRLTEDRAAGALDVQAALDLAGKTAALSEAEREFGKAMLSMDLADIHDRLRAALRADPRHLPTMHVLGPILLLRGQTEDALELARDCERYYPNATEPLWLRCVALASAARFEEARAQLEARKGEPVAEEPILRGLVNLLEIAEQQVDGIARSAFGWMGSLVGPVVPMPPIQFPNWSMSFLQFLEIQRQILPLFAKLDAASAPEQVPAARPRRWHPWCLEHYSRQRLANTRQAFRQRNWDAATAVVPEAILELKLRYDDLLRPPLGLVGLTAALPSVRRLGAWSEILAAIKRGSDGIQPWHLAAPFDAEFRRAIEAGTNLPLAEEEFLGMAFLTVNFRVEEGSDLADVILAQWEQRHGKSTLWSLMKAELHLARGARVEARTLLDKVSAGSPEHPWAKDLRARMSR